MLKPANNDLEWLRRMAALEDNSEISVGGLAHDLGMFKARTKPELPTQAALAKLVELRRRELGLAPRELAIQADVNIQELIDLESGEITPVTTHIIAKLAKALKLPTDKLERLLETQTTEDQPLTEASTRFTAKFDPVAKLTNEEHEALIEFVRFLSTSEARTT